MPQNDSNLSFLLRGNFSKDTKVKYPCRVTAVQQRPTQNANKMNRIIGSFPQRAFEVY